MKICILSDSHDNHDLLEAAVAAAVAEGVEAVVHCGDVVSANALKMAGNHHIPTHVIHGNNSGDLFALAKYSSDPSNQCLYYGQDASLTLHGKRIFLVHYPHYAHAMACTGDYDLVCCGHSHKTEISEYKTVKGTSSWCVNPGSVGGVGAPATYMIGDLETMRFEIRELDKVRGASTTPTISAV
jgi:putative phosphoesterase